MSLVQWANQSIDPKRKYRFRVSFGDSGISPYYVKTASLPKANISVVEHSYFDYNFKFPGRVTWDPITVTMVAPADFSDDPTNMLYDILTSTAGYVFPDLPGASDSSLSKQGFTKGGFQNIKLEVIDGNGALLDEWTLNNCFFTNVDFGGSLEYASDDLIEISFEIQFDWAEKTDGISS